MYSQNDEEAYILQAFEHFPTVLPLRLLDIGAWDPKTFSNSRALIEKGWSAVLIEPSPGPLRNLLKEYPGEYGEVNNLGNAVEVVCAAVGMEHGWTTLSISDDAVSTADDKQRDVWKEQGGYFSRMVIPQVTLKDVLERFGAFAFVNIDTEGTSVDIAKQLFATEMYPHCVCVEHDNRLVELMQVAQGRGYKQVYVSQENAVYVR